MNVKELIIQLLNCNMDAEVVTNYSETVKIGVLSTDSEGKDIAWNESPFVFIEGCDYIEEDD